VKPLLITNHQQKTSNHQLGLKANQHVFDREAVFIERVIKPLLKDLPKLRVGFEHITTADAVP
jgi:dihydroorotase